MSAFNYNLSPFVLTDSIPFTAAMNIYLMRQFPLKIIAPAIKSTLLRAAAGIPSVDQ